MRKWLFCFLLFVIAPIVAAQTDCPAIVSAAWDITSEACAGLERDQACYGNLTLQATPREDVPEFTFDQTGDVVNVAAIETLQLSSMSLTEDSWGVALMQIQANLPATPPAQNVTLLLFGDVFITNAVAEIIELEATTTANVNVRLRPRTDESNVITSLSAGQTITANGRLADTSWIRIVLNPDTREVGWVSSALITSEADLESLIIVESGAPLFAPMQAFYFSSGIGDRPCTEAPDSGILIQTPEGVGEINLLVNEVDIRLGSTIYLQAGNGFMTISVLEGQATVSANGVSQTVPAGTFTQIPLDSDGKANGTPSYPQPYNYNDLLTLPVAIALPQSVSVAQPLPANEIDAVIDIAEGLPVSGTWTITWLVVEDQVTACDGRDDTGTSPTVTSVLTFSEDRQTLFSSDWFIGIAYPLSRIGENTYQASDGALTIQVTFTSATTFTSRWDGIYNTPDGGGCGNYIMEGTGTFGG